MRKLHLLFCISLIHCSIQAQKVELKTIVEHFTNTKCSVCASRNPGLHSNLANFPQLFYISIHPSAPYSSCILSQQNTVINDNRTNFYAVYGSTPRLVINGNSINNSSNYADSNLIKSHLGFYTSFSMKVNIKRLSTDSMRYEISIKKLDTSSLDSAYLFSGNIEDTVFVNGGNGEPRHFNVLRYASQEKLKLPTNLLDSVMFYKSIKLNAIWNANRISSFGVLQNISNKNVIQSAKSVLLPKSSSSNSSILTNNADVKISIYPNPVSSYLNVISSLYQPLEYSIVNSLGEIKLRGRIIGESVIDVQALGSGIYFFVISKDGESSQFKKVIISR